MKDLRLELRVRNNVLWHAILDLYPTVHAFCAEHGFSATEVGAYLNLTKGPYTSGQRRSRKPIVVRLRRTPQRLCDFFGLTADVLFPPSLYEQVLSPRVALELDSAQLLPLMTARSLEAPTRPDTAFEDQERRALIGIILDTLKPREAQTIIARFGLDGEPPLSLVETGRQILGVTRERVRMIEASAMRKLRHPRHTKVLAPYLRALK